MMIAATIATSAAPGLSGVPGLMPDASGEAGDPALAAVFAAIVAGMVPPAGAEGAPPKAGDGGDVSADAGDGADKGQGDDGGAALLALPIMGVPLLAQPLGQIVPPPPASPDVPLPAAGPAPISVSPSASAPAAPSASAAPAAVETPPRPATPAAPDFASVIAPTDEGAITPAAAPIATAVAGAGQPAATTAPVVLADAAQAPSPVPLPAPGPAIAPPDAHVARSTTLASADIPAAPPAIDPTADALPQSQFQPVSPVGQAVEAPVTGQPAQPEQPGQPPAMAPLPEAADAMPVPAPLPRPVTQGSAGPASLPGAGEQVAATLPQRDRQPAETALAADSLPDQAPAAPLPERVDTPGAPPLAAPVPDRAAVDDAAPAAQPAGPAIGHRLDLAHDSQWLDQLAREITLSAAQDGELRFRLNPERLGSLAVEVRQTAEGASIRMTADTESARQIIAEAQPRLVAEARAQGLKISEAQVHLGQDAQQQQQARDQQAGAARPVLRALAGDAENDGPVTVNQALSARTGRYA